MRTGVRKPGGRNLWQTKPLLNGILVVKMLNLTNWLNKQVPGNKLQIEDQNLTFPDRIDSSNKTNPTSKRKMLINDTSQWPLFVQWWHTHWNYN